MITLPILTLLISFLGASCAEAGDAPDGGHHEHRPSPPRRGADGINFSKDDATIGFPIPVPDGGHHWHRPSPPRAK